MAGIKTKPGSTAGSLRFAWGGTRERFEPLTETLSNRGAYEE